MFGRYWFSEGGKMKVMSLFLSIVICLGFIGIVSHERMQYGYMPFHVNVVSDFEVDDMSASVWIPDLGYYSRGSDFDLEERDVAVSRVYVEEARGCYAARIKVSNDYHKDSKWMEICFD
jgi:hypothetical protein